MTEQMEESTDDDSIDSEDYFLSDSSDDETLKETIDENAEYYFKPLFLRIIENIQKTKSNFYTTFEK